MDLADRRHVEAPVDDSDRREEVELTARLIVAVNESGTPLTQEQIDTILGVYPPL